MIATWELMSDQHLYFVREALVITGSSNTRDANNIIDSIVKMQQSNVVINIVSLIGMTYIFQQMCQKTKGRFEVALNEHDFKLKLMVDWTLITDTFNTTGAKSGQSSEHAVHCVLPQTHIRGWTCSVLEH